MANVDISILLCETKTTKYTPILTKAFWNWHFYTWLRT